MKNKLNELDEYLARRKAKLNDLVQRSKQAKADHLEVERDLAIYEASAADHAKIKDRLIGFPDEVKVIKKKCGQNLKYDDEGVYYFSDTSMQLVEERTCSRQVSPINSA